MALKGFRLRLKPYPVRQRVCRLGADPTALRDVERGIREISCPVHNNCRIGRLTTLTRDNVDFDNLPIGKVVTVGQTPWEAWT